ncbi:hypothetical protein SDC9_79244 [bioreactor metagenome]|uniref:Uncharacterized protein n=1 Tax=bioreactor metagenome TaxID=1076179 RepID=A0A644YWJ8_9ZZZZ
MYAILAGNLNLFLNIPLPSRELLIFLPFKFMLLLELIASIGDILDAFTAGKYTPIIIDKNPTTKAGVIPAIGI